MPGPAIDEPTWSLATTSSRRLTDTRVLATEVRVNHLVGRPERPHLSALDQQRAVAVVRDRVEVVADEHHRLAFGAEALERDHALLLEALVADREHLVEQEHVEVDLDRDRVREPHLHARREVLQLLVDEALELREGDDVVIAALELARGEAEQCPVDADVVAGGELRVEPDAELDERRQDPFDPHRAAVLPVDAGED